MGPGEGQLAGQGGESWADVVKKPRGVGGFVKNMVVGTVQSLGWMRRGRGGRKTEKGVWGDPRQREWEEAGWRDGGSEVNRHWCWSRLRVWGVAAGIGCRVDVVQALGGSSGCQVRQEVAERTGSWALSPQ